MARPWGGGASKPWADDVEAAPPLPAEAFPSLGEAAATKSSKKKKGQTVTLSLGELHTGKYVGPAAKRAAVGGGGAGGIFSDANKLTSEEMMALPTGPRERTEEELAELTSGRLGGGFRDFRGDRGGERGDRDQRGFGFDREREASRADESSDWGANKSAAAGGGRGRYDAGGGGGKYDSASGGGDRDGPSRADEVDSWTSGKKFVPSSDTRRSGFDEPRGGGISKADADDNWSNKKFSPSSTREPSRDTDKWSFRRSEDDPNGADGERWSRRPLGDEPRRTSGERPRLNLQPRTLPVEHLAPPKVVDNRPEGDDDKGATAHLAKEMEQKAKVWDGTSSWRKNSEEAPRPNAWKKADNVTPKDPSNLDRW